MPYMFSGQFDMVTLTFPLTMVMYRRIKPPVFNIYIAAKIRQILGQLPVDSYCISSEFTPSRRNLMRLRSL